MMTALMAAGLWGGTDALAGQAARRSTPFLAALGLHVASLVVLLPVIGWGAAWHALSVQDAELGVVAGVTAAVGDVLFGRALTRAAMTVGIPLANVVAACLPALVALAQGATVTRVAGLGIAGALLAACLAAVPTQGQPTWAGAGWAILAGGCFGVMYVLLAHVHAGASLPVIFLMRAAGTLALLPGLWRERPSWAAIRPGWLPGVLSGVASVAANALFILVMAGGDRVVGAVVAIGLSAPAGMLIAHLMERERLTRTQMAAAGCAVAALLLLTLSSA
jgi:hypothetical protein